MASPIYGGFSIPTSQAPAQSGDALSNLIQGFYAMQELPQRQAEQAQLAQRKALSDQLAIEIQRANLAKTQRPQVYNTSTGLFVEDPATGGFAIVPGTAPIVKPTPDPWSNPIATDQGLVQRNILTGEVRPFTMEGATLQKPPPLVRPNLNDPWGDPIQTDQGLVQRNKITGAFRVAEMGTTPPLSPGDLLPERNVQDEPVVPQEIAPLDTSRIPLTRTPKPSGGKSAKLSEDEKKMLLAGVSQAKIIPQMVEDFKELEKAGLAGPVAGRIQGARASLGYGGTEFTQAQTKVKGNLFKLARAFQGAGVLTEKDMIRMEDIAPSLNVEEEQFVGQLRGVAEFMRDNLQSFVELNGARLDPEALKSVRAAEAQLSEFIKPTAGPGGAPAKVTTREEYNALKPGTPYIDSKGNPGTKR